MKVAVSAEGTTLDSPVDQRFARARYFIIYDTDSEESELLDNNDVAEAVHGAGVVASRTMADKGVEVVITGHCGPNAFRGLNAAGIKVASGATGTVRETLERFKSGDLKPSSNPDVQGHW